ncbi:MAG: phosphopentomutase [Firmicutes bacterium]|nr:phosphopentomutase [Bacillota bacterium]
MKRVILIITDSLGIGELPDAADYGDKGADTFGHIVESMPDIKIPNLLELGLANIEGMGDAVSKLKKDSHTGLVGRLAERSRGKDTITGHWEIAGLLTDIPFKTYPDGFPKDFMEEYERRIGTKTLANYPASGTEIIENLGPEHERTGYPIVYTSADSVFQIAANVDVIPLERLYEMCEIAREMLVGDVSCGRVIARPYVIKDGKRERTSDRKDYAVSPPEPTLLDNVKNAGKVVYAVGKISDIFDGQGVTEAVHTDNNMDGVDKTIEAINKDFEGLIFTNLVDFDSKFGHRRDSEGYGSAIEEFDARIPGILASLKDDDLLMICADHGNDPAHTGTDHTREHVPFIAYGKVLEGFGIEELNLGTRKSFADVGATIADILGVGPTPIGESFAERILK